MPLSDELLEQIKWLNATPEQMREAIRKVSDEMMEEIKRTAPIPTGEIERYFAPDPHIKIIPCEVCKGTGKIPFLRFFRSKCRECSGTGNNVFYVMDGNATHCRFVEYGKKI